MEGGEVAEKQHGALGYGDAGSESTDQRDRCFCGHLPRHVNPTQLLLMGSSVAATPVTRMHQVHRGTHESLFSRSQPLIRALT